MIGPLNALPLRKDLKPYPVYNTYTPEFMALVLHHNQRLKELNKP